LTLAEKHADLLQFIAQKESKCLELRSQLAVHEAELLQLKRTWERIVSRSFEFPHSTLPTPATTPSPPTIHTPYSSNVVLEGIKEGVQGVSKLIASGLSTPNADHPNPPSTNSHHHTLSESRKSRPRPHSLYFPLSPSSPSYHIRSSNLSTSSTCTTATSATRFSAASPSSACTFFEEPESWGDDDAEQKLKAIDDLVPESRDNESPDLFSYQELMVRDTGATPTVCPNPRFKFGVERRREKEEDQRRREDDHANAAGTGISILDALSKDEQREGTLRTLTANSSAIRIDTGSTRCHRRKSRETSTTYGCPGDDDSSPTPNPGATGTVSSPAGDLLLRPPVAPESTSPNHNTYSSWTKRWTLGKSQKRASALLSDVSQTLLSTFSLAAGTGSFVASSSSSPTPPALLEEDMEVFSGASALMQPMKPVVVGGGGGGDCASAIAISTTDYDDGEWNW